MNLPRSQRIALFIGISFVGSASLAATFWAMGEPMASPAGRAILVLYTLPPAVAALIVQGPIAKRPILDPFGIRFPRNRWFLFAWLTPVAMLGIALAIAAIAGADIVTSASELADTMRARVSGEELADLEKRLEKGSPPHPLLLIGYGLIAGITLGILGTIGQELGWRGYLLFELRGGFWRRSLAIGAVWGLWYVPLGLQGLYHPQHPRLGALMLVAWSLIVSPVITYLRLRARTLLAAAVMHGTLVMGMLRPGRDLVRGSNDLLEPPFGLTGLAAAAIVLGLLWLHDRYVAAEPLMRSGGTSRTPDDGQGT